MSGLGSTVTEPASTGACIRCGLPTDREYRIWTGQLTAGPGAVDDAVELVTLALGWEAPEKPTKKYQVMEYRVFLCSACVRKRSRLMRAFGIVAAVLMLPILAAFIAGATTGEVPWWASLVAIATFGLCMYMATWHWRTRNWGRYRAGRELRRIGPKFDKIYYSNPKRTHGVSEQDAYAGETAADPAKRVSSLEPPPTPTTESPVLPQERTPPLGG